jgi:glycosyltransferase involved in cell wall biosynthesis
MCLTSSKRSLSKILPGQTMPNVNKKNCCLVLLPTHNRPHYFEAAVNSVLNQNYNNLRLVVLDNSTNEETFDLAKKYTDERIEYYRSAHGVSAVEHGRIIESFLDKHKEDFNCIFFDDDIMCEDHIYESVMNITKTGIPISASSAVGIDSLGNLLPCKVGPRTKYFGQSILRGLFGVVISCRKNPIICPSLVWTRDITMNRCSLFFQSEGYCDYSFNIYSIYKHGISLLQNPTIKLRLHPGQDGNNYRDDFRYWHRLARANGLHSLCVNKLIIASIEELFRLIDLIAPLAKVVVKTLSLPQARANLPIA